MPACHAGLCSSDRHICHCGVWPCSPGRPDGLWDGRPRWWSGEPTHHHQLCITLYLPSIFLFLKRNIFLHLFLILILLLSHLLSSSPGLHVLKRIESNSIWPPSLITSSFFSHHLVTSSPLPALNRAQGNNGHCSFLATSPCPELDAEKQPGFSSLNHKPHTCSLLLSYSSPLSCSLLVLVFRLSPRSFLPPCLPAV